MAAGPQAILYNENNLIRTATIAATAPKASSNTVKPLITSRSGSGRVVLSGAYTGNDDAQIDIKIATGGSTPRVSDPLYSGAGNGRVTDLAVDAATAAQTFTLTLINLGTDSEYADLPFFHGVLKARAIGASGNNITVTVDAANTGGTIGAITKTATAFSVLADIPSGLKRLIVDQRQNAEFNYGGLPLISGGRLDPLTPRLQFGLFPKIYRQYQRQEQGDTVFYLDDETTRTIPAGTVVYNVTGGYRVVVSDGSTTEEYFDVITIFDLLSQLLASQLVEFDGVVVNDRAPDGMNSAEMDLRTASLALNPIPEYVNDARTPAILSGVAAPTSAPTQSVVIECTDNAKLGKEKWKVTGTNSGSLGTAETGAAFTSSALNFTIPEKSPDDTTGQSNSDPVEGDVQIRGRFAANNGTATTFPVACLESWVLGPNARPITLTFTLEKKPDAACACGVTGVNQQLNPACVGADQINFTATGGANVAEAIHADVKTRVDAMYDWYQSKVQNLIAIDQTASSGSFETNIPLTNRWGNNVRLFSNVRDLFISALNGLAAAKDAGIIDAGELTTALGEYDTVKTSLDGDTELNEVDNITDTDGNLLTDGTSYGEYYRAELNRVYSGAGVVPNFNEASTGQSVAPCWFPDDSATEWWRVETSDGQQWAHWHTGFPYYSVVERRENGAIVYERLDIVGLNIEINCAGSLVVGDTITITILGAAGSADAIKDNRFYQVGDKYNVDVIYGAPLGLQGGVSGDDTHTWAVTGSVLGTLDNYAVVHSAETLYDNGGGGEVAFKIFRGGRDAVLGDKITFDVETAQYQWQIDGGGYSTLADLPASSVLVVNGLNVEFLPGKDAPNWSNNDVYSFDVFARFKSSHIQSPGPGLYQYAGATATITATFASDQAIEVIAFPVLRDLPNGAAINIRGLSAADAELWTHTMTSRDGMLIDWFESDDDPMTIPARKLEITTTSATDAKLGWIFAGAPIKPEYGCRDAFLSPAYFMAGESSGMQQFFGSGHVGRFAWDRVLSNTELQEFYSLLSWCKRNSNQPVVAIGDGNNLDIVSMVRLDFDQVQVNHRTDLDDIYRDGEPLGYSLELPFAPVYQP